MHVCVLQKSLRINLGDFPTVPVRELAIANIFFQAQVNKLLF